MTKPQRRGNDFAECRILADITEYGWHAINVVEDDGHPPWTFTIGLYDTWSYPELIIVGRSRATAHEILTSIVDELEGNRRLDLTGDHPYRLVGMPCYFIEVAQRHYEDYVGFARWYYRGRHFPMYQIVWPSNDGHYPWSPKASTVFKEWQPLLGDAPRRV
jgi:hypothetical protein